MGGRPNIDRFSRGKSLDTPDSYSLRWRLVLWLSIPSIAFGFVALWDAYNTALLTANFTLDRLLAGSAIVITEKIQIDQTGKLLVDVEHIDQDMLPPAKQDQVFYRIETVDRKYIAGDKNLEFPLGAKTLNLDSIFTDFIFQQTSVRAVLHSGSISSGPKTVEYKIIVAETTNARHNQIIGFLSRTILRFIATLVVAFIVIWICVSISLRPLSRLQEAISRRNPDELQAIDHQVPLEIDGLVDTINSFMSRLDNALSALRNFTGNASHQLRTPLTIVKTQLALAARASTLEEAKAAAKIGDVAVSHAERILSQLLLMARVDRANSRPIETARIDLTETAKQVVSQYLQKAQDYKTDLGYHALNPESGPVYGQANAMLLEELIRNLVENAIIYSGEGSEITLHAYTTPKMAILEVEDNGPGIPAELRTQVRARFSRVAAPVMAARSANSQNQAGGAGLGLSIASEIAKLFGGNLDLLGSDGQKGLIARVSIPLADEQD